jgi:hypothetical protein
VAAGTIADCKGLTGIRLSGFRQDARVYFYRRPSILWASPILVLLGGCEAKPECDSAETRSAVLEAVANDHKNALGEYAANNSTTASGASTKADASRRQPIYVLGDKLVTTSTSDQKRTLKCSGALSVTVGDTKASKEVDFTVQRTPDGKMAVSVEPFQFEPSRQ